jgi:hypothetical protein
VYCENSSMKAPNRRKQAIAALPIEYPFVMAVSERQCHQNIAFQFPYVRM